MQPEGGTGHSEGRANESILDSILASHFLLCVLEQVTEPLWASWKRRLGMGQ